MSEAELDPAQLAQLKDALQSQKREIRDLLDNSGDSAAPVTLDQQSVGRVSRMDAIQQQQMALANRQQAEDMLKSVEHALLRYENGEYGYCLECGEAIAFGRLQAQPFATLCINCQSAAEEA